jgi:hypothetical protein
MLLAKLSSSIAARFLQQRHAFGTSPVLRGLEDFFETPLKEGELRTAGETDRFVATCMPRAKVRPQQA